MLGAEFSTSDVFLWMLVFFLFVIWIRLTVTLLSDTLGTAPSAAIDLDPRRAGGVRRELSLHR